MPLRILLAIFLTNTLPKTNIAPENGWMEDEISYWEGLFSADISFTEGTHPIITQWAFTLEFGHLLFCESGVFQLVVSRKIATCEQL